MSEVEELQTKLRMIISHASGGALSEPDDVNRSVNDICVEISRSKNAVWEHAQEVARREDAATITRLSEALTEARGDVQYTLDELLPVDPKIVLAATKLTLVLRKIDAALASTPAVPEQENQRDTTKPSQTQKDQHDDHLRSAV